MAEKTRNDERIPPVFGVLLKCVSGLLLLVCAAAWPARAADYYSKGSDWIATFLNSRTALVASADRDSQQAIARLWTQANEDYPVQCDWLMQDGGPGVSAWFAAKDTRREQDFLSKALAELGTPGSTLKVRLQKLVENKTPSADRAWLELYQQVCEQRRNARLQTVLAKAPRFVFTRHRTIRPSFFAYTEGQSDAQNERHFLPGAELCLMEMTGLYGTTRTLLADPQGAIRDPAVSWDGERVLFAWKKSLNEDDYHLYELVVRSNDLRQVTSGLGFADYEPAYLPNGDIIFSSTRCVQTVDCWWTEVSNLYTCDPEGRYLRRLCFDQVHSIYPQVMDDGRVIYTRWDYNDRGQIFTQPLFQMYPDGTGQAEFYGNNSWFPTTIAHARGIPGTEKVLCILCGHHSSQAGKLAVIDPAKGRQENSGVQLVAPVRPTPAERIDSYGQNGELWQYPFPLNEHECLVGYTPLGWDRPQRRQGDARFGIYWMDLDGRRELLVPDKELPCSQPVPLVAHLAPMLRANRVDYKQDSGTFYVQDVYAGPGLAGVPRGTIKKLRVVALDFRAAGVGANGSSGPGGGALASTPISIGNGSWDVKKVLGDATVYEDGSALFTVPARTPVYFQALNEKGQAVQTMRSWSTLQPGEFFGCVGCHEHKNTAPPTANYGFGLAMKAGAQTLEPFYGPARGFSFPKEVQPILDRHCTRCHNQRAPVEEQVRGGALALRAAQPHKPSAGSGEHIEPSFSLLPALTTDASAKRKWNDAYLVLTQARPDRSDTEIPGAFRGDPAGPMVAWIGAQSVPEPLPPYSSGAARSTLLTLLEQGHKGVKLSREELDKLACWIDLLVPYCGDYTEANAWSDQELKKYDRYATKRLRMEEIEQDNIRDMLRGKNSSRRLPAMRGMGPRF